MVDATLIRTVRSTRNTSGKRKPEMHQDKNGNPWYFGMKARIGQDADSGLVHTVQYTLDNVKRVTRRSDSDRSAA